MTERINADNVRGACFKPSRLGRRGYNQAEVEQFLSGVATRLEQGSQPPAGAMAAADVCNVVFNKPQFGRRGFDEDQVDEFLDRVVAELTLLEQGR